MKRSLHVELTAEDLKKAILEYLGDEIPEDADVVLADPRASVEAIVEWDE
jgi:hypothetical protein